MSPLVKVGGLGDVAGSLPRALANAGASVRERVDVRVALPFHGAIKREGLSLERVVDGLEVPWPPQPGAAVPPASVWRTDVHGVPVYLIENERFFGRPNVYGHDDDLDRFLFFCDALLAAAPRLGFAPDVVHAQDWHTALLLTRLAGDPSHAWARCGRVYTIHNLALQGGFTRDWAAKHGIAPALLASRDGLSPDVALSAMAQGIMHADKINTVSDTYALEILTPEYGAGLDGLLSSRVDDVSGIVNGIDYEEFDPETDPALVANYTVESLDARDENKRALQREAGLPESSSALLFGVVTRLFAQKGIDLVAEAFDALLAERHVQLVILGTGDEALHKTLQQLEAKHPQKMKLWLDFDPPLGQRIYAGCDCFLMPSRYEPCGLGQLISLRYGAVPLVRRTGGLNDTVQDTYRPDSAPQYGTGFVFDAIAAGALTPAPDPNVTVRMEMRIVDPMDSPPPAEPQRTLTEACERALETFVHGLWWRAVQERGMRQDWSWARAAPKYAQLYEAALTSRVQAAR
jgi:starch synthase